MGDDVAVTVSKAPTSIEIILGVYITMASGREFVSVGF